MMDDPLIQLITSISYSYDKHMEREERYEKALEELPIKIKNLTRLNRSPFVSQIENKSDEVLLDLNDELQLIGATSLQDDDEDLFLNIATYYDYIRSVPSHLRRPRLEKMVGLRMREEIRKRFNSHKKTLAKVFSNFSNAIRMVGKADEQLQSKLEQQMGDRQRRRSFR